MASIYDLKPKFQGLLRPLCRGIAGLGITANLVTLSACGLSLAYGIALYFSMQQESLLLYLPAVLFLRMALNAIDGMLAREHDQKTPLGAILNELGDVVSDTALYLPLAGVIGFSPGSIVLIVVLAILTEMTGVLGIQIGASRRYEGPMGKSDRAFVFGALGLALGLGVPAGAWIGMIEIALIVLLTITIYNRANAALKEIQAE